MKVDKENYISELKNKNEEALNYVLDNYISLVKGVTGKVLNRFNDDGLIEECINDVFLSVWKHAKSFKGDEPMFKSWVCKIAKMKAIDYYRSRVKKTEVLKEDVEHKESYFLEKEIIEIEDKKELLNLLDKLSDLDKEIFIMKFFLGMKSIEIGKKKNLSETAVNNRLCRGKKRLREEIEANLIYGEVN